MEAELIWEAFVRMQVIDDGEASSPWENPDAATHHNLPSHEVELNSLSLKGWNPHPCLERRAAFF